MSFSTHSAFEVASNGDSKDGLAALHQQLGVTLGVKIPWMSGGGGQSFVSKELGAGLAGWLAEVADEWKSWDPKVWGFALGSLTPQVTPRGSKEIGILHILKK